VGSTREVALALDLGVRLVNDAALKAWSPAKAAKRASSLADNGSPTNLKR
jgi:hypothetical protein